MDRGRNLPDLCPPLLLASVATGPEAISLSSTKRPASSPRRPGSSPPFWSWGIGTHPQRRPHRGAADAVRSTGARPRWKTCGATASPSSPPSTAYRPRSPALLINEPADAGERPPPRCRRDPRRYGGQHGRSGALRGNRREARIKAYPPPSGSRRVTIFSCTASRKAWPARSTETSAKTVAIGLDASDEWLDFWLPEGQGLSGNNGVVSLYDRTGGRLLDAILYTQP